MEFDGHFWPGAGRLDGMAAIDLGAGAGKVCERNWPMEDLSIKRKS